MARITRFYVLISLALIALVASLGIITAKAPEHAYAAGGATPTWTLVGSRIVDTGDGSYLTSYSPSCSSTSMHVDAGDGLGTWSFEVSWSAPPKTLAVGNEDDLLTSMTLSISSDPERRGSVSVSNYLELGFLRAGSKGSGTTGKSIDSQGVVDVSAWQKLEDNYLGDPTDVDDWEVQGDITGCTIMVPDYKDMSDFGKPYSRSHTFNPTLAWKTGTAVVWEYTADIAKQGSNAVGAIFGQGDFILVLTIDVSPGYQFQYFYACAVDGSTDIIIDTDADKNPGESDGTTPGGSTTPGGNDGGGTKPGKSGGNSGNDNGGTKKSGGWIIPVGIIGIGTIGVIVGRNVKKKQQNQTPPTSGGQATSPVAPTTIQQPARTAPQQPLQPVQQVQQPPYAPYVQQRNDNSQQPSTFRMVLWKNIGDTIIDCGPTQLVGARIEEITPEGALIYRDDLTKRITFSVTDNIRATDAGMQGQYRCIQVVSNKQTELSDEKGIVAITFNGEGGTYTNRVHFKVEKLELVFADVPLTFVAGARQTFLMPFKFSVEDIAKGVQPRFMAKLTSDRANEDFTGVRVVIDPDFPDKLFSVVLTECGPVTEDDVPGQMEYSTCEVSCIIPAKEGQGEINLTGSFQFFRFFEGLRFTCEPLKCYVEQYTEKEETLISGDEALTAAATLQSQAMGMAGAVNPAVLQPSVEKMLRESARTAKEMYPEVFGEEAIYVLDTRNKVKVTPARTHAYVTLYVTDEFTDEKGNKYTRPVTALPKWDQVILTFQDIPGSSVLYDKDGKPLARPADVCDFRYFIKDVKGTDNTVVFEILPTMGILLPPNRSKVKVTASVLWKDRTFKVEQEVNAISQPYRKDFIENWEKYTLGADGKKGDDEIRRFLLHIQATIQGRYQGKVAVKGSVSASEVAKDVLYDYVDAAPTLALLSNPITAPGAALWQLYKGIRGEKTIVDQLETLSTSADRSIARQSRDIYYDDLMPLYHYIQMMLDGYDEHFGFFDPDVKRVVITFARFQNGELGSAEAIDLAYTGHDIEYAECMKMIISDFAHSWTMVGLRIGFALFTAGKSEIFFIPFQALASGMEASLDYIDRGGDSMLEAYRVGMDRAGKVALIDIGITVGMGLVGKCVKGAWVLTKEAWTSRQMFFQAMQEMFSTGKYAKQVATAATNVGKRMSAAEMQAARITREILDASRGGLDVTAGELNRDIANTLGRINGSYKVDAVMRMMDGVSSLTSMQKRAIIVAVQSDKHAMRILMQRTSAEAMAKSHAAVQLMEFFNSSIGEIENEVIQNTIKRLQGMKEFAGKEIRAIRTSGNSAKKVGMDLDVTFKYVDEAGVLRDVNSAIGQKAFNAEFYRLVKGALADEATMREFTRMADMTVTDLFHPESYSSDYQNVVRILNESRAGEAFTQAKEVAKAVEYKCMHWLQWANDVAAAAGKLQKLHAAGLATAEQTKEMYKLAALSEALVEEGIRQYTKQAERIIIKKLAAMEAEQIIVRSAVQMEAFFGKVALLKRCGFDLTPAQTEYALKSRFGCTLKEAFEELGVYTKDLSDSIQAVKGV